MSLVNPYCSVAQVQAEIRNTSASITSELEDAINQASRWIDDLLGRDFYQHDHSSAALVIDRWDQCVFDEILFLPHRPVISLSEVKVCGGVWKRGRSLKSCF